MRFSTSNRWKLVASALSLAVIAACSGNSNQISAVKDNGEFEPKPKKGTEESLESQARRYRDQKSFLNVNPYSAGLESARSLAAAAPAAAGASPNKREIEESDVFKVGADKLLYLLNDYRGLQVVSFRDGAENPSVTGRVKATGNHSDAMYSYGDKIIVVERDWVNQSYGNSRENSGRLVVYNVADEANPSIVETVSFEGEATNHRRVGDILYVVTSVWPDYYARMSGNDQNGKGMVYAFDLSTDKVTEVAKYEMKLPTSYQKNMNIIEVANADKTYSYYLVSVLSETRWGWWTDTQSVVEVVDISSPKGVVKPLMMVDVKGSVNKREQTTIQDGYLIVTSNYLPQNQNAKRRIAVESFKLPPADEAELAKVVLSDDEATLRKIYFKRAVEGEKAKLDANRRLTEVAKERRLKKFLTTLADDEQTRLAGMFVKDGETLKKLIPDSAADVGDDQGLNAMLQDVRYFGGKAHVFWVPQNMIDPYDQFDISNPADIAHVGRLTFPGWIEHSRPVSYKGKDYIIGLGWVTTAANNQSNERHPMVSLFDPNPANAEIDENGNPLARRVASIVLDTYKTYSNFRQEDKFIEVKFTGEGQGAILFTASFYDEDNRWSTGGKLIGFDLSQVASSPRNVFTEGGFLNANASWLKRVFTNPEIDMINTFSNERLTTFDINYKKDIGDVDTVYDAISALELARQVRGYADITLDGKAYGVQIISGNGGYWSSEDSSTELRVVPADKADTELPAVLAKAKVKGNYTTHYYDADKRELVLVTTYSYAKKTGKEPWDYSYFQNTYVTVLSTAGAELKVVGSAEVKDEQNTRRYYYVPYYQASIKKLPSGALMLVSGNGLKVLTTEGKVELKTIELGACGVKKDDVMGTLNLFNGQPYLSFSENVKDEDLEGIAYQRNFLVGLQLSDDASTLTCGKAVNIPGTPVAILADGKHVVTRDVKLLDFSEKTYETTDAQGKKKAVTRYVPVTAEVLSSVEIDGATARLAGMYDAGEFTSSVRAVGNTLMFFEEKADNNVYRPWGGPIALEASFRPGGWGRPYYNRQESRNLTVLSFTKNYEFEKTVHAIDMVLPQGVKLVEVYETKAGYKALVAHGRSFQVIQWTAKDPEPVAVKLALVDEKLEKTEAVDVVTVPSYYWSFYGSDTSKYNYTEANDSFEIAEGLTGVVQFFVAE